MKRFHTRPRGRGYHAVFDRVTDARVSNDYGSARDAQFRADRMNEAETRKAQQRERPCLCCERIFISEGPGNRLCESCRSSTRSLGKEMLG